ncbi:MAG: hypothetical protein WCO66_01005 [Candidatus Absconditabacteria bacterium]
MRKIPTDDFYRSNLAKKLKELRAQGTVGKEIAETLLTEESSTHRYKESKSDIETLCGSFKESPSLRRFEPFLQSHQQNKTPFSPEEIEIIQDGVLALLEKRGGTYESDIIDILYLSLDILPFDFIKKIVLKLLTDIYEIHDRIPASHSKGGHLVRPSSSEDHGKNLKVVGSKTVFREGGMSCYYRAYDIFSNQDALIRLINLILPKEEDKEFMHDIFVRLAKFNIDINLIKHPSFKKICLDKHHIPSFLDEKRLEDIDVQKGKILLYMKKRGISFSKEELAEMLDKYALDEESTRGSDYWYRDGDTTVDRIFQSNSNPLASLVDCNAWNYIIKQEISANEIDYNKIERLTKRVPLTTILSLYPEEQLTIEFMNQIYKELGFGRNEFHYIAGHVKTKEGDILDIPIHHVDVYSSTAEFVYKHIALTPGCLQKKDGANMFKRLKEQGIKDQYHILDISTLKELTGEDRKEFLEYLIANISFDSLGKTIGFGKDDLDNNPAYKELLLSNLLRSMKTIEDYDKLIAYLTKDGEYYNLKLTKDMSLGISLYYHLFDALPRDSIGIPKSLYQQLIQEGKIKVGVHMPKILPDCTIPNFDLLMQLKESKYNKSSTHTAE